jgi:2-methylcitrate dehydratase PrpD
VGAAELLAAQGQSPTQIAQNLLAEFGDQGFNLTQIANDAISSNEGDEVAETAQTALQAAKEAAAGALNNFPQDILDKINNFIKTITANTNCPGAPPAGVKNAQLQTYLTSIQACVAVGVSHGNPATAIALNRISQLQNIIQNMP